MGIEPTSPAWKAGALPLCYARTKFVTEPRAVAIGRRTLHQWFRQRQARRRQNTVGKIKVHPGDTSPKDSKNGTLVTLFGFGRWRYFHRAGPFQNGHFRSIAETIAHSNDPRIAALAGCMTFSQFREQFRHRWWLP
jgi:hypothetical protein